MPLHDLVGELGRQGLHHYSKLLFECRVEGGGRVLGVFIGGFLRAPAEVAMARLERVDVRGELCFGDALGFHRIGPASARALLVDEPLQLLPELGLAHAPRNRDLLHL